MTHCLYRVEDSSRRTRGDVGMGGERGYGGSAKGRAEGEAEGEGKGGVRV
jgi:hypothetical protein